MRLQKPRLEPVDESEWSEEIRELLPRLRSPGERVHNIYATFARHPKLFRRWIVFANHVLFKSTLPPREREIVILRIGWLCRAGYEWGQHVIIGRRAGLSDEEIRRVADGPEAPGWDAFEATLLRAVDELHEDAFIGDETWKDLEKRYDTQQLMDLVFAVGEYNLLSMALNTFGVQLDEGVEGLPERR
jgi:alkylhydroperoxidase family enzyme